MKKNTGNIKNENQLFHEVKNSFLDYDPAYFIQNNLILDGKPFRVLDNGWKFMADIYRYIALQSTRRNGKPVVFCKGRQVGATMMAGALDLYFTNSGIFSHPNIRVAHLFPALHHVKKFSQDKLEGLIKDAKDDFINRNKLETEAAVDNITMKQFKTGTLWIDSTGADGDRLRGMTLDIIFYDEIQDMHQLAIENVNKTLTSAKYGQIGNGVQIFFGTPKERGSYFHKIWEMSDQRYYHLGCENCHQTYPFYLPDDDRWRDIWIDQGLAGVEGLPGEGVSSAGYIIQCPLCGHKQHKIAAIELGEWVPSRDPDECAYTGFHINQLYIPYINKQKIESLMPENNPSASERAWNNEVVGEFFAGAGLPLTRDDIYQYARDDKRSFSKRIDAKEKITYLGVDWGGKIDNDNIDRGQSFSCCVVLSAMPDGTLLVEHAHKLRQHNFNYKKETIQEMYRRFGIKRGISDWFYGQDVVMDIQTVYRDKFLGAQGSGALRNPIRFREDELMITYNKDLLIEELFDKIKKGKVRFPWKSYEHIEWLIDHCTSMELSSKTVGGQPIKTYKKGPTPNDGLMALMYAYMAWKFDATKGFTIRPGLHKESQFVKPVLAYAPKIRNVG